MGTLQFSGRLYCNTQAAQKEALEAKHQEIRKRAAVVMEEEDNYDYDDDPVMPLNPPRKRQAMDSDHDSDEDDFQGILTQKAPTGDNDEYYEDEEARAKNSDNKGKDGPILDEQPNFRPIKIFHAFIQDVFNFYFYLDTYSCLFTVKIWEKT
ncbi:hypothetical protein SERLADRAFT_431900 [Serpula lacrymans var. lacrymans S7.9]|uniref:Uncharacterized protein n=1 Tax=Serpula lacrymans var. lacrymans (strain S7.9) TaxID=578457 RepID=F8NE39_SERL9|nr:uncharacterized protein SERLADRAFT_431900 [Serpula lacrymans var. lacrymans S7.9]EGO30368.1 hypothetical protein SERLADRAFT_431900 [Serpula lacrymans var. lacrymans S7.9]